MNTWNKFLLQYDNNHEVVTDIQKQCFLIFSKAPEQEQKAAAVLSKLHRNGVMIYFSPQASKLAPSLLKTFDAQPCEKPSTNKDADGYLLLFAVGDALFFNDTFPFDIRDI
jgi:hypothetical protein